MQEINLIDSENIQQKNAFDMINQTSTSFFLTGRAGTGKTTFLKNVQSLVKKRFIVLAPTGIAAMNAGGQTIHSFFGFNFGVLGPYEYGELNCDKIAIIRDVETIIIDEVSMVRCDLIDAIDRTLRRYRQSSAPFGGVQMVLAGDPFQLEPVVTPDDRKILYEIYGNGPYYFYNSNVIRRYGLAKIEFLKVYRQTDKKFLDILDRARTGMLNGADVLTINRQFSPFSDDIDYRLTLTSTRKSAADINQNHLDEIQSKAFNYDALIVGEPGSCLDAVEQHLVLKEGAQVMFTRNGSAGEPWCNGTIGIVCKLESDKITVRLQDGSEHSVSKVTWDHTVYTYNNETKVTERKIIGRVTQYPLRLAWAITIHKSQGLTFDNVAIDLGRRTFAAGQAYVALSRARSLEGITLLSPFTSSSVIVSTDVMNFSHDYNDAVVLSRELLAGQTEAPFLKERDYDSAVMALFALAKDAAVNGDTDMAKYMISKAMSHVADDRCLMGKGWTPSWKGDYDSRFVDAFGAFYSGDHTTALALLSSMGVGVLYDFDALYLKARCLEQLNRWDEVKKLYSALVDMSVKERDKGSDSESFRKVSYRVAVLNESIFNESGIGIMRQLLVENPYYDRYLVDIRWMLSGHEENKLAFETESSYATTNPIIEAIYDATISDEKFIEICDSERSVRSQVWTGFRKYLNSMKLSI